MVWKTCSKTSYLDLLRHMQSKKIIVKGVGDDWNCRFSIEADIPDSARFIFTNEGKVTAERYVRELEAKRKEILDAGKDTADDTAIPSAYDILEDVNFLGLDEQGEYVNGWGVTDNYDADCPLLLKLGRDLLIA